MREILFRGKTANRWEVGSLLRYIDGTTNIVVHDAMDGSMYEFKVDPETVGQYTGSKDTYGNLIYEGDVVEIGLDGYWVCEWDDITCSFIFCNDDEVLDAEAIRSQWLCIAGNIHDNPELIEGQMDKKENTTEGTIEMTFKEWHTKTWEESDKCFARYVRASTDEASMAVRYINYYDGKRVVITEQKQLEENNGQDSNN